MEKGQRDCVAIKEIEFLEPYKLQFNSVLKKEIRVKKRISILSNFSSF